YARELPKVIPAACFSAAASPWAAHGIGHDFALQNRCSPMQPGLQRKSHSKPQSGLRGIAAESPVFCRNAAKNAPKFLK
ncbi:MAG: hypothetical protein LBN92_00955, partial [Treponema sp.]|nr:hypothetical protein [Treponema sp.]